MKQNTRVGQKILISSNNEQLNGVWVIYDLIVDDIRDGEFKKRYLLRPFFKSMSNEWQITQKVLENYLTNSIKIEDLEIVLV